MLKNISSLFPKIQSIFSDRLYVNSFFLILTTICSGGLGFIFWMLAAHYFSTAEIGIATALISSITLILVLSKMGFDISILRYSSETDRNELFFSTTAVSVIFTVLFGIVFILGVDLWSPELSFLKSSFSLTFIFLLIANIILSLSGIMFVASHRSKYYLFQNIALGSRILFLISFISLGFLGIYGAYGLSVLLTLIVTIFLLTRIDIKPKLRINFDFIRKSFHFSLGNYLSNLFITVPYNLLPLLVLSMLGANATGQYFIVFTMASILYTVPSAVSTSLLVEGSSTSISPKAAVRKSVIATYAILIPLVILSLLFGRDMLAIIGKQYSENFLFFGTMMISSFFVSGIYLYLSVLRIRKDTRSIIYISGLIFLALIATSYSLIKIFGLEGMGYAWIISYSLGIIYIIIGKLQKKDLGLDEKYS